MYDINQLRQQMEVWLQYYNSIPNPPRTYEEQQLKMTYYNNYLGAKDLLDQEVQRQRYAAQQPRYAYPNQYQQPQPNYYNRQTPTMVMPNNIGFGQQAPMYPNNYGSTEASVGYGTAGKFDYNKIPSVNNRVMDVNPTMRQQQPPTNINIFTNNKAEFKPDKDSIWEYICQPGLRCVKLEDNITKTYRYTIEGNPTTVLDIKSKSIDITSPDDLMDTSSVKTILDNNDINTIITNLTEGIGDITPRVNYEDNERIKERTNKLNELLKNTEFPTLKDLLGYVNTENLVEVFEYPDKGGKIINYPTKLFNTVLHLFTKSDISIDSFASDWADAYDAMRDTKDDDVRYGFEQAFRTVIKWLKSSRAKILNYKNSKTGTITLDNTLRVLSIYNEDVYQAMRANSSPDIGIITKASFEPLYNAISTAFNNSEQAFVFLKVHNEVYMSKRYWVFKYKDNKYILINLDGEAMKGILAKSKSLYA